MDEPPADPEDSVDEEGILAPEELDIEDADEVERVGDNRYVVSTDADDDPLSEESLPTGDDPPRHDAAGRETGGRRESRHGGTERRGPGSRGERQPGPDVGGPTPLGALPQRYAIDVQVKTDAGVDGTRIASDDVVTVFEELLLWYATQLDGDTPPEEVLEILLAESSLPD